MLRNVGPQSTSTGLAGCIRLVNGCCPRMLQGRNSMSLENDAQPKELGHNNVSVMILPALCACAATTYRRSPAGRLPSRGCHRGKHGMAGCSNRVMPDQDPGPPAALPPSRSPLSVLPPPPQSPTQSAGPSLQSSLAPVCIIEVNESVNASHNHCTLKTVQRQTGATG